MATGASTPPPEPTPDDHTPDDHTSHDEPVVASATPSPPSSTALPDSPAAVAGVSTMGNLLPDGLVVIGGDRVIRFVNGEAERILGLPVADLVGRPVTEALPLTDRDGRDWWERSDPFRATVPHPGHGERLLVSPLGHEVLVTARYHRAEAGAVERVMVGLRDAEARQRAEREQASVLSTVAHELRAPLTSVTGFTSSLLRRWDRFSDAQKRLMIETIESDAQRLTRLITELLDISRLDSDNLTLHRGPVDLHRVLSTHVVRHELGRATGAVRLGLGPVATEHGLPEMWADKDRLEQVFFNLIENAVQHGGAPVTVTLEHDLGADGDPGPGPDVDSGPDSGPTPARLRPRLRRPSGRGRGARHRRRLRRGDRRGRPGEDLRQVLARPGQRDHRPGALRRPRPRRGPRGHCRRERQ